MNMTTDQKELLEAILENKDFLANILKNATENKHRVIPALNIGGTVEIAGVTWRKFGEDKDSNSYMLADDVYENAEFGETNDWRESSIRNNLTTLADGIKEEIGDRIVPIHVDLLSHDGLDDYGTCEDMVSILTYDLYRKNRKNIKPINSWWWLCTPSSTPSGYGSVNVQFVDSDGYVYYGWYCNCKAVRPFFILRNTEGVSNL